MRSVTQDTITDAFIGYCRNTSNPRLKLVLSRLAAHLHAFAQEVELTHEEWLQGMELLYQAGRISSPERSEFILFSDVLGLSATVDMIGSRGERTEYSNLGPFHIADSKWLEPGGDMIGSSDGDHVAFYGRVLDARSGAPVAGAVLDIWQTAANGLYSNQDAAQPEGNLRRRMKTATDGGYAFTTVRPGPYTVPDDGPVGELLRATGRHAWRPAHFHFMISAEGHRPLTTEIFPDDDPYIDEDAVFGVRDRLAVKLVSETDPSAVPVALAARDRLKRPFYRVQYDFRI
ncbi:MAG TPA: dioxygenase [Burkholderiales bacterium]|jgi:protocatechuate 3,4-dioxygenase beta subunit|nr:dioxygenase [Burkholderiales bacterium]